MKILYIGNEDMRKVGGGKTHFFEVALNLRKIGHQVTVILPGYHPRENLGYDLHIIQIPTFKKNVFSYLLYEFFKMFYVIWYLAFKGYKVVYVRSALLDFMPSILTRLLMKRLYTERNGIAEYENKAHGYSLLYIKVMKLSVLISTKLSHGIVCVSEGVRDYYHSEFKVPLNRLHLVSNGANVERFKPLESHRKVYKLPDDAFIVGFIGTFVKWQSLDILVQAALELKEDVIFVLVGDGPLYPTIKKMVETYDLEDKFYFIGPVENSQVPKYISCFDLCYLCKKNLEGGFSPLKMFEYMASGKAIIANDVVGIKEYLDLYKCGLLFNGESADLAQKIKDASSSKDAIMVMGANGRRAAVEYHSWYAVSEKVSEIISQ
ncbi:glycosyltransferase family 4 protein [Acidaminobacter sp. JC074]|uniref:glycosyltransferase family 4 protein n=1 Tax=Acidaminobacter sp. JC074 TaxID=2530199 RepID=UPI001F0D76F6|nr:glycosyltransferase family 4 protein [Acidaminobacter sp. JC074]